MTPERYQQLKAVFEHIVELAPQERALYLDSVCAADTELRREIDSLIADVDTPEEILDKPISALASELRLEDDSGLLGHHVGPYRLERLLGQGGMGAVYEAWRADDQYRQRVALKLVRSDAALEPMVRRFRQERQILAALVHPHIARLLDGGVTRDGQPYFVMEYVEGHPIDHYCDTHRLSIRERVQLFRDVCSAVQYAHQNLVVHRDLKPSNILVTADGQVKLLDFGIAKLLLVGEDEVAPLTRTGLHLMTPDYASPEQVRGSAITTATDIYSLGVVLYELLTGLRPFQLGQLLLGEIQQIICEEEPAKPSTAASKPNNSADIRSTRNVTAAPANNAPELRPETRSRQLRGDLDNIVLKAITKEPARRYSSAEALSDDIRRYLAGEPVMAHTPTFAYRSAKFVRRHRAAVGSTLLLLLILTAGIIGTRQQAVRAERERDRAERRFQDVRKLANSLLFDFHNAVEKLPGSTPVRRMMVQRALEYLDRLTREAGNDQSLQLELATAYAQVGNLQWARYYAHFGDLEGAWQSQQKARAIREAVSAADPKNRQARLDLAKSYVLIGDLLVERSDLSGALESYRRSLRLRSELLVSDPTSTNIRRGLAISYQRIGDTLGNPNFANLGETAGALDNFRKMQALNEGLATENPADYDAHHSVAIGYEKLGKVLKGKGDLTSALMLFRKELEEFQKLASVNTADAQILRDVSIAYGNIGSALYNSGDLSGTLENYLEALAIRERLAAIDPANVGAQNDVALILNALAETEIKAGHTAEARNYRSRLLTVRKALADRPIAAANDLNEYAWALLTCEFPDLRNPDLARSYAERASALTNRSDPNILDTLALAFHLTRDEDRAVETQKRAVSLSGGSSGQRQEFEMHLQQYRAAVNGQK